MKNRIAPAGAAGADDPLRAGALKILIADDSPEFLEAVRNYLAALPQVRLVGAARNGAEAVDLAGTLRSDILLLDFQMAGLSGLDVLRIIRARHPAIRVIMLTMHATDAVRKLCEHHGADGFIAKNRLRKELPAALAATAAPRLRNVIEDGSSSPDVTEQAGLTLAQLAAAVNHAAESIVITDARGIIQYVNPAFERITGYTRAEAIGRNPRLLKSGQHEAAFYQRLWRTITAGEVWSGCFINRRKDGALYHEESSISPIRDSQGRITNFIAVKQDVTPQRQAELALTQSEERFRQLAGAIEEAFWMTNLDKTQILYISPGYQKIWGRTCQSLYEQPRSWLDAIHADDRERVLHAAESRQISGQFDEEYRITKPDGTIRWIHDQAFPVKNADGGVERIVGVARDITERKQAQEALLRSEKHFRSLIENASDIITIVGPHGSIRYISPSVKRIMSYDPVALAGQNAFDFIHEDDREAVRAALLRAVKHPEQPTLVTHRFRHADGSWRRLESTGQSRFDPTEGVSVVVNSRDVTEQQNLEAQLRQAQKMEAIGQLAGGVAHDFNNLLAVIMMQSELMAMEKGLPSPLKEGLSQIRAAAERGANLTRQLLLFSRKQVMQSRHLDLNDVVMSLAKMLQRIIREDVRLQLQLHPTPLPVHADAGMLDQVLLNLAVNARDAMPEGGRLVIETGTKTVDADLAAQNPEAAVGDYVWLSVTDTGGGIAPEILPRIFEPFFTTKEPGKGTGLGLATVFSIVKQHRGWIKVQSETGAGTVFQVHLPAAEPALTTEMERTAPRGGSETILVVEDETDVRMVTRITLERWGYTVLEASGGVEAEQLWREHGQQIALLLTDLVMPGGLTGQQLTRRLQAQQPGLKTVFMSGYSAEIAGRELELRAGENFLQKPFTSDLLLKTVRQCLDG